MMDFICPPKKEPLTDGISGATPHGSFDIKLSPTTALKKFVVKIEINHSTDFNEAFPKLAKEGESNYSGGKEGSGQPAIVYTANVDLLSGENHLKQICQGIVVQMEVRERLMKIHPGLQQLYTL